MNINKNNKQYRYSTPYSTVQLVKTITNTSRSSSNNNLVNCKFNDSSSMKSSEIARRGTPKDLFKGNNNDENDERNTINKNGKYKVLY